jgi:predicted ATPase/DNA-binding CsgD family transcriptional regulator
MKEDGQRSGSLVPEIGSVMTGTDRSESAGHVLMGTSFPSNLTAEPNSFIGRAEELDELRGLIGRSRALTLCGVGGIGKTRLALRLLSMLADDFPDGVWLVELADLRQPDLVEARIAAVIEVAEEPGRPLLDTLADALRPRRLLLALDNCEHLIEACARTCQRLLASSAGLRVIATSREPLRVAAEFVWQVPPLSLSSAGSHSAGPDEPGRSDAISLFAARAAAVHPGFAIGPANLPAATAVCRALDGVPLAIELAAAWVRVLSVEQIDSRLGDRFALLTTGERTAPARQRTLRAAIDWSHDLLSDQARVLLRRLSVFAGWTLDMAEQVCSDGDLPAANVLDLLEALADKSLVVVESAAADTRYRMLDTVREYAASLLDQVGETALMRQRLCDYTVRETDRLMRIGMALVPASWPARVEVFGRFDAELGNLRSVLAYCLAAKDAERGLRICAAMRPVWIVRGTFAEGAEWLDAFLGLGESAGSAAARGPALIGRAQLALASDTAWAEQLARQGLKLCSEAGQDFWAAAASNLLTEAALHSGRLDEAAARAQVAQQVARKAKDRWNEGYALGTGAAAAGRRGQLREAQRLAEASLAIMREIDHQWGAARTLLGLGDLARLTGDPAAAQRRYAEALGILRQVSARPEIARCLAGLGRIAMEQDDLALARQRLTESIELSHSTGSRIGVIRALDAFAALELKDGRPDRAVLLAGAASACREAAQLPPASGARTQRILDAAAGLGQPLIGRLWAQGSGMSSAAAVALAVASSDPATGPRPPGAVPPLALAGPERPGGRADGAAASAADARPGGLTQRERQIVALIAGSRSNKSIADELFISPATVARHVANILAKLGFRSRAQVAAWATPAAGPASAGHGPRADRDVEP